jgi:hypothetical protein
MWDRWSENPHTVKRPTLTIIRGLKLPYASNLTQMICDLFAP